MSAKRSQAICAFVSAVLIAGCGGSKTNTDSRTTIVYHAVLLDNGQVYFGKLENLGTSYPTLTDVFYVHGETAQDSKQARNLLIQRGNEWHKPDRMRINASHIVLVEPVGPDSRVAQLIRELHSSGK
jgi:hypothetical protein